MDAKLDLSKLSHRYFLAIYQLPSTLRVRKPLEESILPKLEKGRDICIRGFWRIGKTELMKALIEKGCARQDAVGLFFDLRSGEHENEVPKSVDEVLRKIRNKLENFYKQLGLGDQSIDPENPLQSLGRLDETVFLGLDELVALSDLGSEFMADILRQIKEAPANVRKILVCHRNAFVDHLFQDIVSDPKFDTVFVPPITDRELEYIVQTPARECGVSFSDKALDRLAALSGNKPWEVFIFCYMLASALEAQQSPEKLVEASLVDNLITVPHVASDIEGFGVIDNYIRVLFSAMNPKEKAVMMALASGRPEEAPLDAPTLISLESTGWLKVTGGVWQINSDLLKEFISGIVSGTIQLQTT